MEAYLTSGEWRMDDAPLEDLRNSIGRAFNSMRGPLESRRDYFSRVQSELDDLLISKMIYASEIALHPRIELPHGTQIDPDLQHEAMLVWRLFGAKRGEIVATFPDALSGDLKYPNDAVGDRTELMGRYLGFLRPTGDGTP